MLTLPDQSPTFPNLTGKSWEAKRSTVTLPPLGQHAAIRVDNLSSRPAPDSDDLLSHGDSRKRNSTSEHKTTADETPMNGTCESPLDECGPHPANDVPSGSIRLETTSVREQLSCGTAAAGLQLNSREMSNVWLSQIRQPNRTTLRIIMLKVDEPTVNFCW